MRVISSHSADAGGTRMNAISFAGAFLILILSPPLTLSSVAPSCAVSHRLMMLAVCRHATLDGAEAHR